MKKRENSLFTRIKAWQAGVKQRRKQKREEKRERKAQALAQAQASAGVTVKQSVYKTPALTHKNVIRALSLILVCSVISLTAVTVAKYTKELHHANNSVTITGHTGEWSQMQACVKEAYNNTSLHGAYSPAQYARTCTVCGAVETKYVFENAIHNGDFPVSYTADAAWNKYDTGNRFVSVSPDDVGYNLTNWIGYNTDRGWTTVNVAATKDTDTFYVGDGTGAMVIANGNVGNPVSVCNKFILVEGFTYRIGFWCKYEDVLYTSVSNLMMEVRQYNPSTDKWTTVADLKLSDDETHTPFFEMGVSEKGWTYVTSTFTFADDGDANKLEQGTFDLLLQLYQMQIGRMVIDEVSCYPVTHTPENEKDEQYYTRYETERFVMPDLLILNNGTAAYVANGGDTHIDRITYSVKEGSGYTLSNGNKNLTFTKDGEYTVTAHFETDNTHGDHGHVKQADITQKVKVRSGTQTVTVTYLDENGTFVNTGTMDNGIGKTIIPNAMGLSKANYRLDGWYYEEDDQFAYIHKNEKLILKDYTVTLRARYTQLVYGEEIYGTITTDSQTGAYVEAYDFGNKDMWAGWSNSSMNITFTSGETANWNDDKVSISYPAKGDGVSAGSLHYHYAMELQRGVTYYLTGRIQIGKAVVKSAGSCQVMFAVTKTSASSPSATPDNLITTFGPHVAQGKSISNYDSYVMQEFTVPEDGMYYISIFTWGMLEIQNLHLSKFSVMGAEKGAKANVNFAGYSTYMSSKVGNTFTLPYISIPGKKVEGWQQQIKINGVLTNTFIYPMGTKLYVHVKDTETVYVPYITKTYDYAGIATANNLLSDFGARPGSIYSTPPLNNSLEWHNFNSTYLTWNSAAHTATLNYDVAADPDTTTSRSAYYNYPVYLVAGQSYVLKATISYDYLHFDSAGSCGIGLTVFGGRYCTDSKGNYGFNTSSDYNFYNDLSRISPIIGYDSGNYGNTICAGGKVLTNGSQDFSVTFTAPESKTYYVCFRMWGMMKTVNLTTSNVSLTPVNMKGAESTYNYLGNTGNSTVSGTISGDQTGWTTAYLASVGSQIAFDEAKNSITFNLNQKTHDGTAWNGTYGGIHLGKKVTLTKGTYELSSLVNLKKISLSATGGCEVGMIVSTQSEFGSSGSAKNVQYAIPGSGIAWGTGTYTTNTQPSSNTGTLRPIEPLYNATVRSYFTVPADGVYYFYLYVWCPHYFEASFSNIAIKTCARDGMSLVSDRVAGVFDWDYPWSNIGDANFAGVWSAGSGTSSNTDKMVIRGTNNTGAAGVAVRRIYLQEGIRYKLSANYTINTLTPYSAGGARVETFVSNMQYGGVALGDFGSLTERNRIQATAIGYEIYDSFDYGLEVYDAALARAKPNYYKNRTHASYYTPTRTGEFLLVFRFWNVVAIDVEVANITLNPVADENMLAPVNYEKNWQTSNGSGFWKNDAYNLAEVDFFHGDSATLALKVTRKAAVTGSAKYEPSFTMGSQEVYLQKGKRYRLSFTINVYVVSGGSGFGISQEVSAASDVPFLGMTIRSTMSGSQEDYVELCRLGFASGTYTDINSLQYTKEGVLKDGEITKIDYGYHTFSQEFVAPESGTYYANFNAWAVIGGDFSLHNVSLVEV